MTYEAETSARRLHDDLSQHFAARAMDAAVSVQGQGVHWTCRALRAKRACIVSAFQGANCHISFKEEDEERAMGRTATLEDIISAISDWMLGRSVLDLYTQFAFVDKHQRALATIERELIQHCPELQHYTAIEEDFLGSEFNELWLSARDRSCHLSFFGENELPDTRFYWDDCELFEVQMGQLQQLAFALKRWLYDYVMPSALESEFPWIDVGKVARYYEEGRGIEGEFVVSWDKIETFYHRLHPYYAFVPAVLTFIAHIRQHGYDTSLRAGQSLWMLIVSRSRRHGLRNNQASIRFDFRTTGMEIESKLDEKAQTISYPTITFTPEIDRLLQQLQAIDID